MRGSSSLIAHGGDTATVSYKRETTLSALAGFVLSGRQGDTLSSVMCVYLKDVHKGKKGVQPTHAARLQEAERCKVNGLPFVLTVLKQSKKINYLISEVLKTSETQDLKYLSPTGHQHLH